MATKVQNKRQLIFRKLRTIKITIIVITLYFDILKYMYVLWSDKVHEPPKSALYNKDFFSSFLAKIDVFVFNKRYSLKSYVFQYLNLCISVIITTLNCVHIRKIGIFPYFCLIFGISIIFLNMKTLLRHSDFYISYSTCCIQWPEKKSKCRKSVFMTKNIFKTPK